MSPLWEMFPLALQAVYVFSAIVPLRHLYQAKHSDQHPILNQLLTLGAHGAMVTWLSVFVGQMGLIASYAVGITLTLATLGFILYYRAFPGGRAGGLRLRMPRLGGRRAGASVAAVAAIAGVAGSSDSESG